MCISFSTRSANWDKLEGNGPPPLERQGQSAVAETDDAKPARCYDYTHTQRSISIDPLSLSHSIYISFFLSLSLPTLLPAIIMASIYPNMLQSFLFFLLMARVFRVQESRGVLRLAATSTASYTVILDNKGDCQFGIGDLEIHDQLTVDKVHV